MKNLLFTLALLISFGSYAQEKTKIYKGLTEAMSKSEVKAEMKKNKDLKYFEPCPQIRGIFYFPLKTLKCYVNR